MVHSSEELAGFINELACERRRISGCYFLAERSDLRSQAINEPAEVFLSYITGCYIGLESAQRGRNDQQNQR